MQKLKLKKEYQKYPEYKDSGIDWLGKIPEGWDERRMKFCISKMESGSRENVDKNIREDTVPSIGGEHIVDGKIKFKENKYITQEYYNSLHKGKIKTRDILLVKDGATIGKIGIAQKFEGKMAVNEHVYIIRSNEETKQKFLYYLLNSPEVQSLISLETRGSAQGGLNTTFTSNISNTLPSKKDQQKIVEFLDEKTELIDKIVKKKKQLIELLKEKRTAIINQAVTKGLNGNVEMKDGGIEWIGKIPENWSIKKLKFIAKINERTLSEYTNPNNTIEYLDISNVGTGLLKNEPVEMIFRDAPNRARRLVKAGSVILATVRTYLRAIAFFEKPIENLVVSTGFAVFDANKKIIKNKFLYYFALSEFFVSNVASQSTGVSYPAIAPTTLGKLPIFIPDLNEQEKIMQFLDKETDKVEIFSKKVKKSINLLSEFKSSLISNVVTGKVKI